IIPLKDRTDLRKYSRIWVTETIRELRRCRYPARARSQQASCAGSSPSRRAAQRRRRLGSDRPSKIPAFEAKGKKAMAKAYKHLRRQRTERRLKNQSFMEPSKRPLTGKRKKSFIRSLFSKDASEPRRG